MLLIHCIFKNVKEWDPPDVLFWYLNGRWFPAQMVMNCPLNKSIDLRPLYLVWFNGNTNQHDLTSWKVESTAGLEIFGGESKSVCVFPCGNEFRLWNGDTKEKNSHLDHFWRHRRNCQLHVSSIFPSILGLNDPALELAKCFGSDLLCSTWNRSISSRQAEFPWESRLTCSLHVTMAYHPSKLNQTSDLKKKGPIPVGKLFV